MIPDLRFSSSEVHENWQSIVIGGTRQDKGMASFADIISAEESRQIHEYIIYRALHESTLLERLAGWVGSHACLPVAWLVD